MTKEKMNVHKALTELKMLDKRISSAIDDEFTRYCLANKASNKKINGDDITTYQDAVKSHYQSVIDLMKRRIVIKQAVVKSNAETVVEVAGQKYTVAEAIEMKNHGLEHKEKLHAILSQDYSEAMQTCNRANLGLEDKARQYILSLYGESEKSGTKNQDHEEEIRKYIDANTYSIIDPIDVKSIMDELREEIDSFMTEVDAALSTSNAVTMIEIEY